MVIQSLLRHTLTALLAVCLILMAGDRGSVIYAVGDLDGDGTPEGYYLAGGRLTVTEGRPVLWRSAPDWRVDGFVLGDVNNDGAGELALSLWKTGCFSGLRPFWHTGEDTGYKHHLFVFQLRGDMFHPAWCSSDLDRPIVSFSVGDVDGDGLNELVTEEGRYRRMARERYGLDHGHPPATAVWQWGEWGVSRQPDQ